jgi:hypothetical protein
VQIVLNQVVGTEMERMSFIKDKIKTFDV